MPDVDAAVIGGGICGLTCAFYLRKRGLSVALLEASDAVGGSIRSLRAGPYLVEGGPQSLVASPALNELVDELGLRDRVVSAAPEASRRYLFDGVLVPAPMSPGQLLGSPLLTWGGKVRLLRELWVPRKEGGAPESLAAFVERRAGREVLERIAAPVVGGIFAGDPASLETRSAFPILVELERDHGSVIRGARQRFAAARRGGTGARPISFADGNAMLTSALGERLGEAIRLSSAVSHLSPFPGGIEVRCGWPGPALTAAKVIIATPPAAAGDLLEDLEPKLAGELRQINAVPIAQIALAYPKSVVGVPLDGFGFLASRRSGLRILGAVFNSVVFGGRAPADELLVTAFAGGAGDRDILALSDAELIDRTVSDLSVALKAPSVRPKIVAGLRYERAIPQYTLGHAERVARIEGALRAQRTLALTGNYLRGISVPDCIRDARAVAQALS